jgi:hypothetical protein
VSNPQMSKSGKLGFPFSPAGGEQNSHELSFVWWLLLPPGFFILRYAVSLFTDKTKGLESWFVGELGVVENLTVVLLVMALILTVYVISRYGRLLQLAPKLFLVFYCLGCVYFAGEEASWGQHWFGWKTGEFFMAINDQGETNFHNTSVALDRLPKAIVSLAIFVGGIVFPLYLRRKALKIDCTKPFWWLFPTWICLPTAFIAIAATWPAKIERYTDTVFYFDGAQEIKELYIAGFFLLFMVSLYRRLRYYQASATKFSPQ